MLDVQDKQTHWRVTHIDQGKDGGNYLEQWRRQFATFGDMPKLTQTAVAVLTMQDDLGSVPGLGRRVSKEVYWLEDTKELLQEYEDGAQAATTT
jgi:hypothetical protein